MSNKAWYEQLPICFIHGPITKCVKLRVAHAPGMPGSALTQLVQLNQRMADVEQAMQDTSDHLEAAVSTVLPAITRHMAELAEGLAKKPLEVDVHRRKWNLVIHGLEGVPVKMRQSHVRPAKTLLRLS